MKTPLDDIQFDGEIIKEAREKRADRMTVKIACALFTAVDGSQTIAYPMCEYGDGDATRQIKQFVKDGFQYLKVGETLGFRMVNVKIGEI